MTYLCDAMYAFILPFFFLQGNFLSSLSVAGIVFFSYNCDDLRIFFLTYDGVLVFAFFFFVPYM